MNECRTCRFFDDDPIGIAKLGPMENEHRGLCKRFPPSIKIDIGNDIYLYTQPLVYPKDFCGEFEQPNERPY